MKVKELIAELQKHDLEMRMVVSGYEGGFSDVGYIGHVPIRLNAHKEEEWWMGEHEECDRDDNPNEIAILISDNGRRIY